ncbi:MAG: putative glycolipid-binding domain-containing protein [Thaumarchaeota archaeon]|nr:putative glycolipid-binding domain-containing protein [Nitrososphaerota archaeon]
MSHVREERSVVWKSLKPPGYEFCTVGRVGRGWRLFGALTREVGRGTMVARYDIVTDASWGARSVVVESVLRGERAVLTMRAGPGRWKVNGKPARELDGCRDVDLGASPSTNILPMKRRPLRVGGKLGITAAWVRFPGLSVAPLEQTYTRLSKTRYRYQSAGGFSSEIEVDGFGLVKRYGEYWTAEW